MSVSIPDDGAFASFKSECLCEEGWSEKYDKRGVTVWSQFLENSVHKIKVQLLNALAYVKIQRRMYKMCAWTYINLKPWLESEK